MVGRQCPLLEKVLDPRAYPTAARVGTAVGTAHGAAYSSEHAWEFGLSRVLDGLAALIDRRTDPTETKPQYGLGRL
ncbi:hypothetical protein [Streptomyces actuosus]|uniref:hypothetical protein n=1 Tax=Streptomyces actuosus TaxID=1885 RepID=UPI003F682A53